jgi:valyl-tRNA synthetase
MLFSRRKLANERQKQADALAKIATIEQSLAGLK